jgi:hypothetical protein
VSLVYDNSEGNPNNPSIPPVDVTFGEQSTDEMGTVLFGYVLADERGGDLRGGGSILAIGDGDRERLRGLLGRFEGQGGAEGLREAIGRLDRDGDGRVARDEVPERFVPLFDRADLDGDGSLDPEERDAAADRLRMLVGDDDNPPRRQGGRLLDRLRGRIGPRDSGGEAGGQP